MKKKKMSKKIIPMLCLAAMMVLFTGCAANNPDNVPWEKHITEEEIIIDGISGEYELLFLTDTHAVVTSKDDTQQIKDNAAVRSPEFKNKEGVSGKKQLSDWIAYANETEVDGVLFGGDIIDYPSPASFAYLEEELSKLNAPYVYTLGNHDWTFPWEYMTEQGKEEYLPQLAPYMEHNTAVHSVDFGEFIVVAVDNSAGQVNGEALAVYEEILNQGKPVIVLVHVPFMTQSVLGKAKDAWSSPVVIGGGNYGGIYPNEESERFDALTTAADSPVAAVIAGHVHFYDKDVIDGKKAVLQLVGDAGFHGSAMRIKVRG